MSHWLEDFYEELQERSRKIKRKEYFLREFTRYYTIPVKYIVELAKKRVEERRKCGR